MSVGTMYICDILVSIKTLVEFLESYNVFLLQNDKTCIIFEML